MNLLGVHLQLQIGESKPTPVPVKLSEALKDVEVTHGDDGPSVFQLKFQVGRSGPRDLQDYGLLSNPLLQPFNRVIVIVYFAIAPQVLMDGIITDIQLTPSEQPGADILTITGEDVSVMMDRKERNHSFPDTSDFDAVKKILKCDSYTQYGFIPPTQPDNPSALSVTNRSEQIHQQPMNMTDRAYLKELARMYNYVFYITPGPTPGVNTVHWGSKEYSTAPQSDLSVKMGPFSNVDSINFQYNALSPQRVQYTERGESNTVSSPSQDKKPLARNVAEAKRTTYLTGFSCRAATQAQGVVDDSSENTVTVKGELNVIRYNGILNPRGLVNLRGVGDTYGGKYYVKTVTHKINKGHYGQSFTLKREGTGKIKPF